MKASASVLLSVVALLFSASAPLANGAEAAKDSGLSAEDHASFKSWIAKVARAREPYALIDLKKSIDEVVTVTHAGPEAAERILEQAQKALPQTMQAWALELEEAYLPAVLRQPQVMEQVRKSENTAQLAKSYRGSSAASKLTKTAIWNDALKSVLTAEQFKLWSNFLAEKEAAKEADINAYIKRDEPRAREYQVKQVRAQRDEVHAVLGLSEDRLKSLDGIVNRQVGEQTALWRNRVRKYMDAMEAKSRQHFSQQGRSSFGYQMTQEDATTSATSWEKALATVLSPEELERLKQTAENRRRFRTTQYVRILVAEQDREILFTAQQRKAVESAMADIPKAWATETGDRPLYLSQNSIWQAAQSLSEDVLKDVVKLDASQIARWKEAGTRTNAPRSDPKPATATAAPVSGPVDVEKLIADEIHRRAQESRKRMQSMTMARVTEITLGTKLPQHSVQRLTTAAKGAAELALWSWIPAVESWIRSSVRDTPPGSMRERLKSLGPYNEYSRGEKETDIPGIWTKTVQDVLTPEQHAAWQRGIAERNSYASIAVAGLVLVELDDKRRLSSKQIEELIPLTVKAVEDYGVDVVRSHSAGWYLQPHYRLLITQAIPEPALKSILTADQWKGYQQEDLPPLGNNWSSIQRLHDDRLKREKADAAKK